MSHGEVRTEKTKTDRKVIKNLLRVLGYCTAITKAGVVTIEYVSMKKSNSPVVLMTTIPEAPQENKHTHE